MPRSPVNRSRSFFLFAPFQSRQCAGPWSTYPSSLLLAVALGALLFLTPDSVRAETRDTAVRELSLSAVSFVARVDMREIEGRRIESPRGAFSFEPRVKVIGQGARRRLVEIGGRFKPGVARYELIPTRNLVRVRTIEKKPHGRTALELIAIEILEGGRTIALIETRVVLSATRDLRMSPVDLAIDSWNVLEVVYHARLTEDDEALTPIPELPSDGRLSLRWNPGAYALRMESAREPGRPPRPAELRHLGSGLTVYPPEPFIDDTFAATIIVQNAGDVASTPQWIQWRYGAETAATELPPIPGGATASLRFSAVARDDEDRVELNVGNKILQCDFKPLRRPVLVLTAVDPIENYTEDPLEMKVLVTNKGSGSSLQASLVISTSFTETVVMLPPLPARQRVSIPILWRRDFQEPDTIVVELRDDNHSLGLTTLRLARRHRPRPRFTIEGVQFEGERGVGNPGRVRARIRNRGDLEGSAEVGLDVLDATGRALSSRVVSREIPAGEEREFISEAAPQEPGLLRARVRIDDLEEVDLFDVPPPPAGMDDTAVSLYPGPNPDSEPVLVVTPVSRATEFQFHPIDSLEELDTAVSLVIRSVAWRNQNGMMVPDENRDPRPVLRASISSGAWRDKFEIASTERTFRYPLTRSLLAESWTLTLEPAGGGPVYLVGPPRLIAPLVAEQYGRIVSVRATDTGVYCVIVGQQRRIRSPFVTASLIEENGRVALATTRAAYGARAGLFLATSLTRPGRHTVSLTLPLSPSPDTRILEQFISPVPFPRIGFSEIVGARSTRSGAAGVLAFVPVTGAAAPDLRMRPLVGSRPHESIAFNLVPAGETIALWAEGADGMFIDLGPVQESGPATRSPGDVSPDRLRILDLGGDTPSRRSDLVIRYIRSASGDSLPAGRVWLVVSNILRASQPVPALPVGARYVSSFRLPPLLSDQVTLLLFERDGSGSEATAFVDTFVAIPAPASSGPTRAERDWTYPVTYTPGAFSASSDTHIRASDAAWSAARFLIEKGLATIPPISPEPARDLSRLSLDTSATGRIAYRETLARFVEEWRTTGMLLSGAQLPVTVESSHLAAFLASLDRLDSMAGHPSPIDRARVESEVLVLISAVEYLLGRRVDLSIP